MTDTSSPWPDGWPGDSPWRPLPDDARRAFRWGYAFGWSIPGLLGPIAAAILVFTDGPSPTALGVALVPPVLAGGLALWQSSWAFRYTRWRLDEDGFRLRRGCWWRREMLVPRARVQHLDIERGPIERRFGLATLVIHTAGFHHGELRQAGFAEDDAMRLRDALVPALREHDDGHAG
ncbi:PH domain-containing protein [Silanimonas sp.]|jgi:membrane protein YdbS with pleckstrin-like domain|uniref:PH domain-containing protein n=1 Tax=Silanimonas sp. TaxID=1929290 RepID=UPI0022C647E7|nr:PH domain-containing protein [Silanimonas sp.]MCZ8061659.1 PH domain-containing protein [Silanimonas sp.]MCZ8115174.1 PH domain-containing protein [Silanimonas sp.]